MLCYDRGMLVLTIQDESLDHMLVTTKAALCASLGLPFRGLGIFGSGTHKQYSADSEGLVPSEDDSVISSPDMTESWDCLGSSVVSPFSGRGGHRTVLLLPLSLAAGVKN